MTALQTDPSSRLSNRNLGPAERRAAHCKACNDTVQHIKHPTKTSMLRPDWTTERVPQAAWYRKAQTAPRIGIAIGKTKFVFSLNKLIYVSFLFFCFSCKTFVHTNDQNVSKLRQHSWQGCSLGLIISRTVQHKESYSRVKCLLHSSLQILFQIFFSVIYITALRNECNSSCNTSFIITEF
jgi:hypothetical protein